MRKVKKIFIIAFMVCCFIYAYLMVMVFIESTLIALFGEGDYSISIRGTEFVIIVIAFFTIRAAWKRLK